MHKKHMLTVAPKIAEKLHHLGLEYMPIKLRGQKLSTHQFTIMNSKAVFIIVTLAVILVVVEAASLDR